MTKKREIWISRPVIGDEECRAVEAVLRSGWLVQGSQVKAFEEAFAKKHAVGYAIATSSCTTALHLILAGMGIGPGDEVLVPAFTWVATANAVLYCGAKPVFVDVDSQTYNIDPKKVKERLTSKTRAIVVVHLFGLSADIDAVKKEAPGIPLIEDAACAAGSRYRGKSVGSLGAAAAFSFHPRKSITTGEGGMVTTNDSSLAEKIASLRNHGAVGTHPSLLPDFPEIGFNYRMTDLQGALGLAQLSKLDPFIEERNRWAGYYSKKLGSIDWLETPQVPAGDRHGWQSYVCRVRAPKSRDEVMARLLDQGIHTRPGTHSVPHLTAYRKRFGFTDRDCPVSRELEFQTIALPLHNAMSEEDYAYVVEVLRRVV